MIDYKESKEALFCCDQIECSDKEDLIQQIKLFANKQYDSYIVDCVKLVKDKERDIEKPISKSLINEIKKLLNYTITTSY